MSFNGLTVLFSVPVGAIVPSSLTVADVVAACAVSDGANAPNTIPAVAN
ncbi:hypothetical protein [Companilactobacillus baiquanensis]|nr:hypothetical protein [Companilactobacillus baiquanensis]